MSKSHRHQPEKPKPRDLKRQRQRDAMSSGKPAWYAVFLPEPEAPVWKPLG